MMIGYGGEEVATDLLVVGEDWWLERHSYDGAEWFEYKTMYQKPTKELELFAITTRQCVEKAREIGLDDYWCYAELEKLNRTEEEMLRESD